MNQVFYQRSRAGASTSNENSSAARHFIFRGGSSPFPSLSLFVLSLPVPPPFIFLLPSRALPFSFPIPSLRRRTP